MSLKAELELSLDLAQEAGNIALKMQNNLSVTHKAHGLGPVSNADIALDKLICEKIAKKFPNDLIISEESFKGHTIDNKKSQRIWFIDPIDGTSSYILGRDDFVIMIGLAIDQKAQLGVIFQPAKDLLWWGINHNLEQQAQQIIKHQSCEIKIRPGPKLSLSSRPNLIVSRNSRSKKVNILIDLIKPKKLIYMSSFGLKVMMVMQKEADLYICWASHVHAWDTCAPTAIMSAAGAILSFLDGKNLAYNINITHPKAIMASRYELDPELRQALLQIEDQKFT